MYETKGLSERAESVFKTLLWFYPQTFRKRFASQLLLTFDDMYQEEMEKNGRVGIGFWSRIFTDLAISIGTQHLATMKKQGFKTYFRKTLNLNIFNILGFIFLIPFFSLFLIDLIGRLVQGDLFHYNRTFYKVVSQTPLYSSTQALFFWLILLPFLAVSLNLIPLLFWVFQKNELTLKKLLLRNAFSWIVILSGLFFLLVVFGHDFLPCFVNSILFHSGAGIGTVISVCKNA